jgi:hypothetical protein
MVLAKVFREVTFGIPPNTNFSAEVTLLPRNFTEYSTVKFHGSPYNSAEFRVFRIRNSVYVISFSTENNFAEGQKF